ncbi:beta-ketoacyl-[acyl-carrier-protein] synthase family protein [Nocardia goodfellowii]|uniref:3-oxoacyl-[acyl-carrier-protein] synthase-3 n=1 Tax=Nocardia goodfellowii TaxID=882446 RepID=A0ABS4QMG9_9NOCA|nr:hypothetical protein [Nocardia goodfellowii]MBP2192902.1 3-oxoacyl-[acyl-carrier-protein] synthase-3 [Nocardia goodfellowii]
MRVSIISSVTVGASAGAGSVERSALAVREVLDRSGIDNSEVALLLNTGIHRDDNIVEPAIAALIQKKAGINLRYHGQRTPALSFDIMNGPCGFLDAVQVAAVTGARKTVIVAGEGHPSRGEHPDFPYLTSAAAVVVAPSPDDTGFGTVYRGRTTAPARPLAYMPLATMGSEGCRVIALDQPDEAARERGLDIATEVVLRCLEQEGLDPADCVLLAGEPRPGFAKSIAAAAGIDEVHTPGTAADPHSAALPFAYRAWLAAEPRGRARHALFLAADGHFAAACAPYGL